MSEEGNCDRNFFFMSSKKANGMRRPSSLGAMTRYVTAAWEEISAFAEALDVEDDEGESAM